MVACITETEEDQDFLDVSSSGMGPGYWLELFSSYLVAYVILISHYLVASCFWFVSKSSFLNGT